MIEIKLTKRYPNSRTEDITDAYMRGWNDALDAVQNGKFHIADTPQTDLYCSITEDRDTQVLDAWQTDCGWK
jgi:hypothetical protein